MMVTTTITKIIFITIRINNSNNKRAQKKKTKHSPHHSDDNDARLKRERKKKHEKVWKFSDSKTCKNMKKNRKDLFLSGKLSLSNALTDRILTAVFDCFSPHNVSACNLVCVSLCCSRISHGNKKD